jgi:hypothetical protein
MLTCLGLADRYAASDEVLAAGSRLAQGTVALLEEHATAYRDLIPSWAADWLGGGSLRRYVQRVLSRR